jgi:hypothetical protein
MCGEHKHPFAENVLTFVFFSGNGESWDHVQASESDNRSCTSLLGNRLCIRSTIETVVYRDDFKTRMATETFQARAVSGMPQIDEKSTSKVSIQAGGEVWQEMD